MLAEAIGYSEKTVSKWETDGCVPPVDSLFRIASFFHTDLNSLFQSNEDIYYLGIDGGGTKTALALEDSNGTVIRQIVTDTSNPFDVGIEKAKNVLKDGISRICEGIPFSSVALFAGIAGSSAGTHHDPLMAFLLGFRFAAAWLGSDNDNIIAAGLREADGITLILGTGVCSFVVHGGQRHRIGGWGYLFDEGGSAFNIARDALSRYFSVCDGSGTPTSLETAIREKCGCEPAELLNQLYEGGKRTIASYSELVFREAEKGDPVSCDILRRNMSEVARIIRAARSYFTESDEPIPVILAGGLTRQTLLLPYLKEALGEPGGLELKILSVQPVEGALIKAKTLWKEANHP